jgi:hypothetical protein
MIDASSLPNKMKTANLYLLGLLLLGSGIGCAHAAMLPGTNIPATDANREIVETIEEYRQRLVERNVDGILLLASEKYFEDGGTPQANDDYGYAGLATVLSSRLQRVGSIRYDIQYKSIKIGADGRAEVEAFLSGAFELQGEVGERYRRVSDFHRFTLERASSGGTAKWKFVSGM